MSQKVFIGVGHGGSDPGAVAGGFKEKDLNLPIALACREELERHGVTVLMSREKDEDETLSGKIDMCNRFDPALALDIHNNAGGGDGAEVFHSRHGGTGKTLALNILEALQAIGQNSRGAKTLINTKGVDGYLFIRNTYAPAVIVECAFMDTPKDLALVDTASEQKKMGIAIAAGILKTLGIDRQPAAPVKNTLTLRTLQLGATGQDVRALQLLLAGNGYKGEMFESGYGSFGANTRAAVELCQKDRGLPVTGVADLRTWTSLLTGEATVT